MPYPSMEEELDQLRREKKELTELLHQLNSDHREEIASTGVLLYKLQMEIAELRKNLNMNTRPDPQKPPARDNDFFSSKLPAADPFRNEAVVKITDTLAQVGLHRTKPASPLSSGLRQEAQSLSPTLRSLSDSPFKM